MSSPAPTWHGQSAGMGEEEPALLALGSSVVSEAASHGPWWCVFAATMT
jgi:hypothetical protein